MRASRFVEYHALLGICVGRQVEVKLSHAFRRNTVCNFLGSRYLRSLNILTTPYSTHNLPNTVLVGHYPAGGLIAYEPVHRHRPAILSEYNPKIILEFFRRKNVLLGTTHLFAAPDDVWNLVLEYK